LGELGVGVAVFLGGGAGLGAGASRCATGTPARSLRGLGPSAGLFKVEACMQRVASMRTAWNFMLVDANSKSVYLPCNLEDGWE